ncbi:hypothetical protein W97_09023, partial [Coniosporium apollinis CBS 100218]
PTTTAEIEIEALPTAVPENASAAAAFSATAPTAPPASPPRPAIPRAIVLPEYGRLTQSPRATPASLREREHTDDYMSYNPSYGVAERFRDSINIADGQSPRDSASSAGGRLRANTGCSAQGESGNGTNMAHMSDTLPEDDGMRVLRQKIHAIRDMEASSEEKARRMHLLMMERYQASHAYLLRAQSPSSITLSERPHTPASTSSMLEGNAG